MVPRYRICRDVLCPLRSTTAIRTLSCGAPHPRTRADRENWVGWTGGGIAGAGLGWSFCVAVQRRSTSANALPHRTTRYKGYHQDGNHSEFGSHHREVGGSLRRRPQGVWQARIELRRASRELTAWRPAAGARAERSRFDVVLKSARITSDLNQ